MTIVVYFVFTLYPLISLTNEYVGSFRVSLPLEAYGVPQLEVAMIKKERVSLWATLWFGILLKLRRVPVR